MINSSHTVVLNAFFERRQNLQQAQLCGLRARRVVLPGLMTGGRLGQIPCDGDCGIMLCTVRVGRASQLSSFREFLLVGNKISSCAGQMMNPSRGKRRCTYLLDMSHFHCPWVLVISYTSWSIEPKCSLVARL